MYIKFSFPFINFLVSENFQPHSWCPALEDSVISRIVSTLEPGKFSIFLPIPIHANPPALRSNFVAASQLVRSIAVASEWNHSTCFHTFYTQTLLWPIYLREDGEKGKGEGTCTAFTSDWSND